MAESNMDRRFHYLTKEQVQTLDQVLTEVIPIHGRGNFPTLEVKPRDIIHVVRNRLTEKQITVRDVRLNGSTASHVLVKENGTNYKDLDIIFGVELPKQEDFQIIKEVVLGCLLDFLPRGVNKDKITALTMKEAYVQKMVKVFTEHDRWSLISLSNNSGKNVELKFVSSLRRQFEFSVDSFQIILDSMLESYLEAERRQEAQGNNADCAAHSETITTPADELSSQPPNVPDSSLTCVNEQDESPVFDDTQHSNEGMNADEKDSFLKAAAEAEVMETEATEVSEPAARDEEDHEMEVVQSAKGMPKSVLVSEDEKEASTTATDTQDAISIQITESSENADLKQQTDNGTQGDEIKDAGTLKEPPSESCSYLVQKTQDPQPPPAKKSYKKSQMVVLKHSSPKPPRKMSKKVTSGQAPLAGTPSMNKPPLLASLLLDPAKINSRESIPVPDDLPSPVCSSITEDEQRQMAKESKAARSPKCTQAQDNDAESASVQSQPSASQSNPLPCQGREPEITPSSFYDQKVSFSEIQPSPSQLPPHTVTVPDSAPAVSESVPESCVQLLDSAVQVPEPIQIMQGSSQEFECALHTRELHTKGLDLKPVPDLSVQPAETETYLQEPSEALQSSGGSAERAAPPDEPPPVPVLAESMYGDFEQALDHLRYRLIATRNPEEIRGGGLLKYSNLLVRDFKPASETEIKTLERYMCSRFFIDFPDVNEQQRKIESYLRNHFIGEEKSKYDYLMTLRRVVNESTVCLMGHERRQTLNMITILALKVLGEQNIIPNTTNVTCYYQPAPYMADHNFNNYYIAHSQPPLIYHPYPLHIHMQTGLV